MHNLKLLTLSGVALSALLVTAHADTWTVANADGSVTRTQMAADGTVTDTTTTPDNAVASNDRRRHDRDDNDDTVLQNGDQRGSVYPDWRNDEQLDWQTGNIYRNSDRRNNHYRGRSTTIIGGYPYAYGVPGYYQSYPYSYQLPGAGPFGGPVISVIPSPGVQGYVPANPYYYGVPNYGVPTAPVYSYPYYQSYLPQTYAYPYGNGSYVGNSTTIGGSITLGRGGVNARIGGSRTNTQTSTSTWSR